MTTSDERRPIGVLGATGQQGGAVVDALLDAGATVRAVVRDASSDKAVALRGRGVELAEGDQNDPDSMDAALRGLDALFLMFTFADSSGTEGEVRRGTGVGDAAVRAAVPRVVYSSVGGAERHSGIPHFESKRRVEEHLLSIVPTQIVRPAYFMDNLAGQLPTDGDTGDDEIVIRMPMPGDVALQMVSVRDIGRVAAAALLDATALGSEAIEIGGDELTGDAIAAVIAGHYGRPSRYEALPIDSLGDGDLEAMFRWFVETPAYNADFARTKRLDPDVLDLASWLALR